MSHRKGDGYTRGQRGDTIVEVLIAIAVVSGVMGLAYSIMNRNLLTMRNNQERTQAVKIAQGQIEALKALWDAGGASRTSVVGKASNIFCIAPSGAVIPDAAVWGTDAGNNDMDTDNLPGYPADCRSTDAIYSFSVRRQDAAGSTTYRATVRWDKVGGGRNQVMLVYRLQ